MFATLNLDFTSPQTLDIQGGIVQPIQSGEGGAGPKFTDLLKIRIDATLDVEMPHGEFLPEGGNGLPQIQTLPSSAAVTPQLLPTEDLQLTASTGDEDVVLDLAASGLSESESKANSELLPTLRLTIPRANAALNSHNPASDLPADRAASPVTIHQVLAADRYLLQQSIAEPAGGSAPAPSSDSVAASTAVLLTERNTGRQTPVVDTAATNDLDVDNTLSSQRLTDPLTRAASALPVEALPERLNMPPAQPNPSSQAAASALQGLATGVVARGSNEQSLTHGTEPVRLSINTPVSDAAWGDRISEKVMILAGNQNRTAEIRLTPAELGPVRVTVAVDDGVANVSFHAQNVVAREAIEQAMPRLREFLAENGLTLGQSSVGDDGVKEGNRDANSSAGAESQGHDEVLAEHNDETARERQKTVTRNALVDTFA